jgi:DNA polymerase (family 10)
MISNKALAEQFEQFAKILELKNELSFKISAYQRAAEAIRSQGESLEEIYKRGGIKELQKIEGIGESISQKIEEYIKTGKIKELERLKNKIPKAELEFMEIPGVGPKTAKKLFEKLKAKNINELKEKLKKQGLKFFKEKTQANILRGIEIKSHLSGRMLLADAKPYVDSIIAYLNKSNLMERVTAVGSFRRFKETVGDIDLVATSSAPARAIKYFVEYPEFTKIITSGETKSTVIHSSGIQVDLEILPENEFGSLLQHFTGSKEHNIALRTYAQEHGFSISEHGIKEKSGKLILCSKEEDVYKTLKMDYIEPELREDRGEIEAALKHQLPKLVELKDVQGDLHMHSNWSDGSNSIEEMAQKAKELKYKYIAISDHTVSLAVAGGLDAKGFLKREKELKRVNQKFTSLKILNSCEVNIKPDGTLDLPEELLRRFDIVTASVHSSFNQSKEMMTKRLIRAIENPNVDIIGHPSGRIINRREGYQVDWPEIFKACVANKVALEINAFPDRLDLVDSLVQEAKKFGVKFVICTDAHNVSQMDNMIYGISVARRGWAEAKDVLSTRPFPELQTWFKKR